MYSLTLLRMALGRTAAAASVAIALVIAGCSSVGNGGGGGGTGTSSYSLGGTINGLTSSGLVLADNGVTLAVDSGASSFTIASNLSAGTTYSITVATQPTGLTCSVAGGAGTMPAADVTDVAVTCTANAYTLGGTISGLTSAGLVLADNGVTLAVDSGASSFTFASPLSAGTSYSISVATQPTGLTCSVADGAGTMPEADVTNVAVTCTASTSTTHTLGGTISGLTSSGLQLSNNGGAALTVNSGATSFQFGTGLTAGSTYSVTVAAQPSGLTCSIADGSGTMPASNVTSVQVSCGVVSSGGGDWIWESGSYYAYSEGIYGTEGVAASNNTPGSRYQGVSWTDPSGNLWLFAGYGADSSGNNGALNDIWSYNRGSGQWTWKNGSDTANPFPNWGTQGVTVSSNNPGGRSALVGWGDSSGNLYIFGGSTLGIEYVLCNDLWKYNISTGLWTWLTGPNVCTTGGAAVSNGAYTWETTSTSSNGPVYGTQGVPASGNTPGNRKDPATWVDASGNLWMFGGISYGNGYLSDLWRYQPSNGLWTWMGGSQSQDSTGVSGSVGQGSTSYYPSGRQEIANWTDNQGNLWLFGGQDPGSGNLPGYTNDLWKYNIASGVWTWVSGSTSYIVSGSNGVYGTQGVGSTSNTPGARFSPANWIDSSGNLWLWGGSNGKGPQNTGPTINYSDMWMFNPSNNEWTWVNGPNYTNVGGTCGTEGVASTSNLPGARDTPFSWTDPTGGFWMFGGDGLDCTGAQGNLGDLWKY
jgi:Galactose oxidase, central domain